MKERIIELSVDNRSEVIELPINPKTVEFTSKQLNQTITLLEMGEVNLAVADLLDKIMPSMISVATVLVLYKLLGKKGMKITTLILIVIIFSMICSALGILA